MRTVFALAAVSFLHAAVSGNAEVASTISYGSYFGGSVTFVTALATDGQGNLYLTGYTISTDLQTTTGSYRPQPFGREDAFVAKVSPTGALIWSTYLGGAGNDTASAIAVDSAGNVYVGGTTTSADFPVTPDALRTTPGGTQGFLVKLDPAGAKLLYATYVGGGETAQVNALAIGSQGTLALAGNTTKSGAGAYGFAMGWRLSDMKQVFSMTLGGSGSTAASAVAVDGAGNVYVAGNTNSADFPLKNGLPVIPSAGDCTPHLSNFAPCSDAFVTKLSADGQTMVYSTRLGGSDADVATALAVDASGSAIIAGNTASADFPLANAFQSYPGDTGCLSNYQPYESSPCPHQFAARLAPDGSRLIYSTYLGRKDASIVAGVALDSSGNAIVTGTTMGHGLSATPFAWQHCNASQQIHSASIRGIRGMDGIEQRGTSGTIAQLRPDGTLAHATYFGGTGGYDQMLAVVASGVGVWIASMTASTDLPTAAAAIQTNAGLGYFAKVDFTAPATPPRIDPGCVLNSGNLIHDYLAPYEIVTIFGSNLGPSQGVGAQLNAQGRVATELAGTMVTFSGYPAPLLYVSAGQVNAIVPHLITGIPRARVEVTVNGVTSEARQELARLASPAFFSSDMSGTGQAIAVNEDGTVNSAGNPAVRGSVVAFWMTGAGLLNKPYEDGEIVTGDPGGLFFPLTSSLPVLYAGQAPGMVAGVVQINLRIGQDFPPWITSVAPSVTVANVGTYPVFVSIR